MQPTFYYLVCSKIGEGHAIALLRPDNTGTCCNYSCIKEVISSQDKKKTIFSSNLPSCTKRLIRVYGENKALIYKNKTWL